MTDRELLEAAARAAGIAVERCRLDDPACRDMLIRDSIRNMGQKFGPWNPLQDDGDALRLAVRLGIHITNSDTDAWASTVGTDATLSLAPDPYAATRRAIVRAAAAMAPTDPPTSKTP